MNQDDKQKKIALVTGAGSGIGKAVAQGLLNDGYSVVLAGRRIEPLTELAEEARAQNKEALAVSTDVRSAASVDDLFSKIESSYGRIDVVFNNAGINGPAVEIDELAIEKWQEIVDTNLTGVFLCARAAFRLMKRQNPQGGRIINNGSISAHAPRPLTAPYTATKHAITGLTKTLALDGRPYNIACSQIDIGNALTSLSERMLKGVRQANGSIAPESMMDVKYVVESVRLIAGMPLDVNVLNMTVMATKMPFVGRG
ncbi:MAG: SDR family oxidoreductase [Phycisphaerales bacterium]|nr:SDR family oxidoreductase [Phycisphaerales bacterium]